MRILMFFLFLSVMQPAIAVTKCMENGRVTYKYGTCPPSASSQYLVKDKFVDEGKLQRRKQKRITEAEKGFERLNNLEDPMFDDEKEASSVVESEIQAAPIEPVKMQMSDESPHFQLKAINQLESTVVPVPEVVSPDEAAQKAVLE